MDDVTLQPQSDADDTDRNAIIMMLVYVEAECRRLGDTEAARHAALAAALINGQPVAPAMESSMRHVPAAVAPIN
jgi:hypothetical protein